MFLDSPRRVPPHHVLPPNPPPTPQHQVAQVLGGVLGATLAIVLVPKDLQRSFSGFGLGVRPGVLLWQGLVCELALALVLNLIVLWSLDVNPYIATWTLLGATLVLVVAGAELTGPSMNPAIVRCCFFLTMPCWSKQACTHHQHTSILTQSFGWFFHFKGHELVEHVLVFWVAPLMGGLLAGLGWNALVKLGRKKRGAKAKRKTQ